MGRAWVTLLRVAVGIALLGVLIWWCDPRATWEAMRRARLGVLGGALGVYVASMGLVAWRWQVLLMARGVRVGFWPLTRMYLIGFFFNNFLPSSVGGDIVRITLARRNGCRLDLAVSSIFVERLIGFLAMALLALSTIVVLAGTFASMPLLTVGIVGLAVVFVGVTVVCFERRAAAVVERALGCVRWRKVREVLQEFYRAIHAYRAHVGTLARVFGISLLYQVVLGVVTFWVMRATGLAAPFTLIFALMQVASMAGVMPITFESLGVREGLYVFVLAGMQGYDKSLTLAAITLVRVVGLIGSGLGGVLFALEGVNQRGRGETG